MTFFPEVTPADDDSSEHYMAPEWAAPPVDCIPSRIGVSTILARTDDIAVMVTGLSVHASGLQIDVHWLLRNRHQKRRDWATLMDRLGADDGATGQSTPLAASVSASSSTTGRKSSLTSATRSTTTPPRHRQDPC